ncbi:MAG: NUDIX hydrolase, partial [Acidimicrobiia bacterium]|nr:NUDIX hydrolase [Acidimicrobiia bacterium]
EGLPRRFDTRFFVAEVGDTAGALADGVEVFDDTWVRPAEALEQGADGSWEIPFPTLRHLEMLARHGTIESVLEYADGITSVPGVLPRVVMGENGSHKVLIPGDPGYETEAGR